MALLDSVGLWSGEPMSSGAFAGGQSNPRLTREGESPEAALQCERPPASHTLHLFEGRPDTHYVVALGVSHVHLHMDGRRLVFLRRAMVFYLMARHYARVSVAMDESFTLAAALLWLWRRTWYYSSWAMGRWLYTLCDCGGSTALSFTRHSTLGAPGGRLLPYRLDPRVITSGRTWRTASPSPTRPR